MRKQWRNNLLAMENGIAKRLSGCLKIYSAVILCSAVTVGWKAHPTAGL
ncbi:MAG: hypothetical protein IKZ88_01220 [Neisseriaceae bacterium]|nr:hypothetical protein [Neisseriaceae bacterium]